MTPRSWGAGIAALLAGLPVGGGSGEAADPVGPAAGAVKVAAQVSFLEGPAVDADGHVFFSDIAGNRILRMAPDGTVSTFREGSGRTNGNTFDA